MNSRLRWVLCSLVLSGPASAAEPIAPADNASAMYSHGVHGYFSGNLHRAEIYLQRASDLNPKDPRTYYFHGLTLIRLGRTGEAEAVIQQGATIEATTDASAYNIGEALQRVQGGDRLRLERARREALVQQTSLAADNARRRYEQLERRQAVVQRQPIRVPLEALMNPVDTSHVANWKAEVGAEPVAAKNDETASSAVAAEVDRGDPFTDDPLEEGDGVRASSLPGIFGRIGRKLTGNLQPGSGLADQVRGLVPGMGEGNVPPGMPEGFGEAPGAAEDPFGTDENPATEPEEDPFGSPSNEDPFGEPGGAGGFPGMPEEGSTPPEADSGEDPFN